LRGRTASSGSWGVDMMNAINRTRHAMPVALSALQIKAGDAVSGLTRVVPDGDDDDRYVEDLLQRVVHYNPQVLPLWDIEPAFYDARSICVELPLGPDPSGTLRDGERRIELHFL